MEDHKECMCGGCGGGSCGSEMQEGCGGSCACKGGGSGSSRSGCGNNSSGCGEMHRFCHRRFCWPKILCAAVILIIVFGLGFAAGICHALYHGNRWGNGMMERGGDQVFMYRMTGPEGGFNVGY